MDNIRKLNDKLQALSQELALVNRAKKRDISTLHSAESAVVRLIAMYWIEEEKQPTAAQLARDLEVSVAAATTIIDRLVQKGVVEKVRCNLDRRARHLSLTDHGNQLFRDHVVQERKDLQALTDFLGKEDTEALIRIMGRVNTFIDKSKEG